MKKGVFVRITTILRFVKDGIDAFHHGSIANYASESVDISRIKGEVFKESTRIDDKVNLVNDRKRVCGDVRKTFHEIVLKKGQISVSPTKDQFSADNS